MLILSLLCFFILLTFPTLCVDGARQGLLLWGLTLVPTLLPYFIVTKCILQFEIPSRFLLPYLLLIGYGCGYPTGAASIYQLYSVNTLTKKQANLLLCFCNHTSPGFLISFVHHTYFKNQLSLPAFLLPIYLSSILCSILFYFVFGPISFASNTSCMKKNTIQKENLESIFINSIYTIVKIGCYMIIFSIFIQLLFSIFHSFSLLGCTFSCFLEITTGLQQLSLLPLSFQMKKALMSALCTMGGCCSIAQVYSASHGELSLVLYVLFKLLSASSCFLLVYFLL